MQKGYLKITLAGFILLAQLPGARAQSPFAQLTTADSLFSQKKYTQSFDYYQSLFNQNLVSPAMLLRMAYVEEGLGRFDDAMYYLGQYYNHTFDEAALTKMQELAKAHKFTGYEWSEMDRLAAAWRRYGYLVTALLVALTFIFTGVLVRQPLRGKRATTWWVIQSFFLVLLLVHLNYPFKKSAIVQNGNTYLMSGPSAGAPVVDKIGEGHRVKVLGKVDVWVKIKWNEEEVFVRESDIKILSL